ncbi:HNH endonuclease, partial [Nocardia beijingensis]
MAETIASLGRDNDWAAQAYDAIRSADDVDRIASHLETVRRPDGSPYTRADIEAVKNHIFYDEHPLEAVDGGHVEGRFEAHPEIAEAWIRLRSGRHTDSDLLLLEHELAEHQYLAEHPEASYAEAHRAANTVADWERGYRPRRSEDYYWEGPNHSEEHHSPVHESTGGSRPVPGQTGAESIPPPRYRVSRDDGEFYVWDIPYGSSHGEGANQPITPEIHRAFNIGGNYDPARPKALCSYCRHNEATQVDHVLPKSRGGDLTADNLTPACDHCNNSKNDRNVPRTPADGYEGVFPPSHWPEEMRASVPESPYGHYPSIQRDVRSTLERTREQLLSNSSQVARERAESRGLNPVRRKIWEARYREQINEQIDDLQDVMERAIHHVTFDPDAYRAWLSDAERIPIDVRIHSNRVERVVFIRDAGPDGKGLLLALQSKEHWIAVALQEAHAGSDPVEIERRADNAMSPTERGQILVGNYQDAHDFGLGRDVPEWAPDRGNVLAERLAEHASGRGVQETEQPQVVAPQLRGLEERAAMSLAEREQARDQAARDRDERRLALDYREQYRRQHEPDERAELEATLDARQRKRDELEQQLDVREGKRDNRARESLPDEIRVQDGMERDRDERLRANLEREQMRDARELERFERASRSQDLPEHVREFDERIRELDARERALDTAERERIELERVDARENNLTDEQRRQLELERDLDAR